MIQVFGHPKCKASRAAERFFSDRGLKVQSIDLHDKGIAKGELTKVAQAVGGVAALYDVEGARVKERGLQHAGLLTQPERLMTELLNDPKLLKTPIVRLGAKAAVGLDEKTWKVLVDAEKAARVK